MRDFLAATLLSSAMLCGAALAQSAPPSAQNPSAAPAQPQAEPSTPSTAQPETTPQDQQVPQTAQAPASSPNAANSGQTAGPHRLAPGSVIPVQLTKTVDAKKVKTGDQVVAKVTMDLKSNSGEVILPKDTKVMGHVTEAQARSKEQKESQLAIAFDRAVMKDGEMSMPMSIQAVIAPPSSNENAGNDQAAPAPSGGGGNSAAGSSAGRTGSSGTATQSQAPRSSGGSTPSPGTAEEGNSRPQINGNTQGVVGISNLKLESGQNVAQGSVLTSEKNNVKVESGTMLLLRVNQ